MLNDDTMKVLNDLVQSSEDSKNGFVEAAHDATKPELKCFFQRRSGDCETAVAELQALVQSLGGAPNTVDKSAVAADRDWSKMKPVVGNVNLYTLAEVEHAENRAEAAYVKALSTVLPQSIRSVVQRQYNGAVRNHDHIRGLRNAYMEGT